MDCPGAEPRVCISLGFGPFELRALCLTPRGPLKMSASLAHDYMTPAPLHHLMPHPRDVEAFTAHVLVPLH